MYKAFKYRIYPTQAQEALIQKHFAASACAFNVALKYKKYVWGNYKKGVPDNQISREFTQLKKLPEYAWLSEVYASSLTYALHDMFNSYDKFVKYKVKLKKEAKDLKPGQKSKLKVVGIPKYKNKDNKVLSYTGQIRQSSFFKLENKKVYLPFFKEGIKVKVHRLLEGEVKEFTISKTKTDKYFVSLMCDTGVEEPTKVEVNEDTAIGIDVGIKDYMTFSDGKKISNPKYLEKAESKLAYIQRKYSKNKGKRTLKKITKLHEKITNKRVDFIHKQSKQLVRDFDTICLENLDISEMKEKSELAKEISSASWGRLKVFTQYKTQMYGKNVRLVPKYTPTTKTCSNCGYKNDDIQLKDRFWQCPSCLVKHDRDINAAINVKKFGLMQEQETEE
jgi:putative transposase